MEIAHQKWRATAPRRGKHALVHNVPSRGLRLRRIACPERTCGGAGGKRSNGAFCTSADGPRDARKSLKIDGAAFDAAPMRHGLAAARDLSASTQKEMSQSEMLDHPPQAMRFDMEYATASGNLSEIDMGLNGGGSFSLVLYLDSAGAIGPLEWSSGLVSTNGRGG
jgi:hypothetical protein